MKRTFQTRDYKNNRCIISEQSNLLHQCQPLQLDVFIRAFSPPPCWKQVLPRPSAQRLQCAPANQQLNHYYYLQGRGKKSKRWWRVVSNLKPLLLSNYVTKWRVSNKHCETKIYRYIYLKIPSTHIWINYINFCVWQKKYYHINTYSSLIKNPRIYEYGNISHCTILTVGHKMSLSL